MSLMDQNEIIKSIELLTIDPFLFSAVSWLSFCDRGNCCTGNLKLAFETDLEKHAFENFRKEVEKAMPRDSKLYRDCAEQMRVHFERNYVYYTTTVKLVARVLYGTHYDDLKNMLIISLKYKHLSIERILNSIAC